MIEQKALHDLSDLPLSGKMEMPSIFSLLGLPNSANLALIRKAYYKRVDQLEKEKAAAKNEQDAEQLSVSLRTLDKAFHDFSKNLENNTKELYETKKSLDGLKLDKSATWEGIESRYQALSSDPAYNKEQLNKDYNTLKEKKNWFTSNDNGQVKTLYAGLGALAAAGVSVAAMSQFTDTPVTELVSVWVDRFNASPTEPATDVVSVLPTSPESLPTIDNTLDGKVADSLEGATAPKEMEGMQDYIDENLNFEDDLLSTLGLMPDIHQTLGVNFKVEMLQSLIKNI